MGDVILYDGRNLGHSLSMTGRRDLIDGCLGLKEADSGLRPE